MPSSRGRPDLSRRTHSIMHLNETPRRGRQQLPPSQTQQVEELSREVDQLREEVAKERARAIDAEVECEDLKRPRAVDPEVESLRKQLAQARDEIDCKTQELGLARQELAEVEMKQQRESKRSRVVASDSDSDSESDGEAEERLRRLLGELRLAHERAGERDREIDQLRADLMDERRRLDQLKLVHKAEVAKINRQSSSPSGGPQQQPPQPQQQQESVNEDDRSVSQAVADRLRDQINELEAKCARLKEEMATGKHEKALTLQNMEDLQRRYDKKNALLEAEAKRALGEAGEAKQKLANLRRETDSLRPKLATLDILQPKVERLQASLVEKEEQVRQLKKVNQELVANGGVVPATKPSVPLRRASLLALDQQNQTVETSVQKPAPSTGKKAFLISSPDHKTRETTATSSKPSGDDDVFSMDGCSWLAEAQGLLSKMNSTKFDFANIKVPARGNNKDQNPAPRRARPSQATAVTSSPSPNSQAANIRPRRASLVIGS